MRAMSLSLFALGASLLAGSPAFARAENVVGVSVAAEVAPFCRLYQEGDGLVQLNGGNASLGNIRELCNARSGYTLRAEFTNLEAGMVEAGGDQAALQSDGSAQFTSSEARSIRRDWYLRNASIRDQGQPVIVRFSVTPL